MSPELNRDHSVRIQRSNPLQMSQKRTIPFVPPRPINLQPESTDDKKLSKLYHTQFIIITIITIIIIIPTSQAFCPSYPNLIKIKKSNTD